MSFRTDFLVHSYLPDAIDNIPFGQILNDLFFDPIKENQDFPIHGPNAIRFIEVLISGEEELINTPGLVRDADVGVDEIYGSCFDEIKRGLGADSLKEKKKVSDLLKIALLFHDIGKFIRRSNHPPIGANLVRNYNEEQRQRLVDALVYEHDERDAKHNRFSLITSIIQHHDKFGVVSTGEGALPLFSDILYFTSDASAIQGIQKNITSVMLSNVSDIASVCTAPQHLRDKAYEIAKAIRHVRSGRQPDDKALVEELLCICKEPGVSLGLDSAKLSKVIDDWRIVMNMVEHEDVQGDRVKLKKHLLDIERNPARAIKRVLRLLQECSATSNCDPLIDTRFMSSTSVESILVGTLGAHQFQTFCELLATVAKLDYGLNFFKAIICACVRKEIHKDYAMALNIENGWNCYELNDKEKELLSSMRDNERAALISKITTLFVRTLEGLLNRYIGVLGYLSSDPRRFGFQMRPLTSDEKIRDTIINLLCIEDHKTLSH